MSARRPLPAVFADGAFRVADARPAGVSRRRLRGLDLEHPYHGLRAPLGMAAVEALLPAFRPGDAYTGATAAQLWELPLPRRLTEDPRLHVSSVTPTGPMRRRGVVGRSRADPEHAVLGTIPVLGPVATWASLAGSVGAEDLVAVTDRLLFGTRRSPPLVTHADLTGFLDAAPGSRGARRLRMAVESSDRAWSRPETLLRLLLRNAGLPPFAVNEPVALSSGRIRYPDLAWPDLLIAVEYDGRGHDTADQVAADAVRREEFADDGWLTVHVRARELFRTPSEIVARVVRRRAQRGAPLPHAIEMTKTPRFEP